MWHALIAAALTSSALIASATAADALQWRDLTNVPTQPTGRYATERASEATGYTVTEGDFDGDGQSDRAALYFHENDLVIAARLSTAPDAPVEVWRGPRDALEEIGITTARPGRFTTACFRYNWDCGDDRTEVQLDHQGIILMNFFGPAEWVYFWVNDHFENELMYE